MKNWQKALIATLVTLAIGGIYLYTVWKKRQNPGTIPQADARQTLSLDQLAVVREFFPVRFWDTLRLEGKAVWEKNGYVMPYYPYARSQVLFATRAGVIPAAQRMGVKKIVKAAVPAAVEDKIEHGSRRSLPSSRCREARRSTRRPSAMCRAAGKPITLTCSSTTMIRTRFTITGPRMCGRPSTRTR